LLVDALVAIHDEVAAWVGAGLSRKRSAVCSTFDEFPFSVDLFPSAFEEFWPSGIVGTDLLQVADLHLVEQSVVVGNSVAVNILWSFEAVRAGEIH